MLSDACRWVLEEIRIPPAAEGGMVEYRRTLIISLLFKFYLKVRRWLNRMVKGFSGPRVPGSVHKEHALLLRTCREWARGGALRLPGPSPLGPGLRRERPCSRDKR